MFIEFDQAKRDLTLQERGLDFADAMAVYNDSSVTFLDDRKNYGEDRFVTVGMLCGRTIVLVWTPRGEGRRIVSMRYANEREITRYARLD